MATLIEEYYTNPSPKVSLGEVVDCFKGKAVSKFVKEGNLAVINLVDITEIGIDYDHLKMIDTPPASLSRYLLEDVDVLIASKGTVKKIAVFEKQNREVIASANITVLRPTADILGYYIKLFLDTELGQMLLEETNTGKSVMNLSTQKILSIKIPQLPLLKQSYFVQRYRQGLNDYKRKLSRAEQEWSLVKAEVKKGLF